MLHQTTARHSFRYPQVDIARGLAVICMAIYHFCFDLNMMGLIHQSMNDDNAWLVARCVIVSAFMCLVGVSLVLAETKDQAVSAKHYYQRLLKLGCCALLVTLGSKLMFPESYIFFGVLHCIFIASVIGKLMVRFYLVNLFIGVTILLMGSLVHHETFNYPYLQWIGMMTYKPYTEDYVPIFPWLGMVLTGIFLFKWTTKQHFPLDENVNPKGFLRWIAMIGRNSLAVYMLHQPILIGFLWLYVQLTN